MARVSAECTAKDFKINPWRYPNVLAIGKESLGMSIPKAALKFQCGKNSVVYWRKVYLLAENEQTTFVESKDAPEDKLVTIQIPVKILDTLKRQELRIQYLEAALWRKTEELANLRGKRNDVLDSRN